MGKFEQIDLQRPPQIADIALLLGEGTRGDGKVVDLWATITTYQEALDEAANLILLGRPLPKPFQLFVPDLWMISKGHSAHVPKEEGQRLYEAQIYGHKLGHKYLEQCLKLQYNDDGYPGVIFANLD